MNRTGAAALLALLAPLPALAHHGKDFLVVESYEIPHPGDVFALATSQYERDGGVETAELEPATLIGVLPGVAAELHAHFVKEDDSGAFKYEAIAPSLHVQLTDHDSATPVQIGASAEYEIGAAGAPDAFEGRLILEKSVDQVKVSLNGIVGHVSGQDAEFGYAGGVRLDLNEVISLGAEAQGSFHQGTNEGLIGLYLEPSERFTFKIGAGTRVGSKGPDATARLGIVYHY